MTGNAPNPDALIDIARNSVRFPGRRGRVPISRHRQLPMPPRLADCFRSEEIVAVRGTLNRPITAIVMDSRRVVPGALFFALPGRRFDGARFINEALNRGAVAVVASRLPATGAPGATLIQVADPRAMLARAARRFHGCPDRDLAVVGVTGTNGKTTVSYLIRHLLAGEERVGQIGTISYDLGARSVPSFRTTPEAPDLFGMLAQMRDAGCRRAVMEVSSHGIDQMRVLGLEFAAAVFTNLTRDHLDYHRTLDAYFDVKRRLFTGDDDAAPHMAVINVDDPYGRRLVEGIPPGTRVVTYGEAATADVRAEDVQLGFKDSSFRLIWPGGSAPVASPLLGRYNVSNVLAAIATAWALGRDPATLLPRLADFAGVPGRMERVDLGQPYNVLVDYAHTDDALRNALGMLRAITPGRLLVVFGCGGNRDRAKRPLMVQAVQEFADLAFATADNPRGESLEQIFADMRAGVTASERIQWIEDRRRALSLALDAARSGDSLLVAGKGHESYQEFADTVVPFDDRQVVRELIAIKSLKEEGGA